MDLLNKGLVLSLNNMTWSRYDGLDIRDVAQLTGSTREENLSLILDHTGNLFLFPGSNIDVSSDGIAWTKKYSIPTKQNDLKMFKMRRIKARFTGDPEITVRVFNEKFTGGYVDYVVSGISNDTWRGLIGSLKGYWFQVGIKNAISITDIEFELIIYGEA